MNISPNKGASECILCVCCQFFFFCCFFCSADCVWLATWEKSQSCVMHNCFYRNCFSFLLFLLLFFNKSVQLNLFAHQKNKNKNPENQHLHHIYLFLVVELQSNCTQQWVNNFPTQSCKYPVNSMHSQGLLIYFYLRPRIRRKSFNKAWPILTLSTTVFLLKLSPAKCFPERWTKHMWCVTAKLVSPCSEYANHLPRL